MGEPQIAGTARITLRPTAYGGAGKGLHPRQRHRRASRRADCGAPDADSKDLLSPEEVLRQHRELSAQYGTRPTALFAEARQHGQHHESHPGKSARCP